MLTPLPPSVIRMPVWFWPAFAVGVAVLLAACNAWVSRSARRKDQ